MAWLAGLAGAASAIGGNSGGGGGEGGTAKVFGLPDYGQEDIKQQNMSMNSARGNMFSTPLQGIPTQPMTAPQQISQPAGLNASLLKTLNEPINVQPQRANNPYGLSLWGNEELKNPLKRGL